MNSTLATDPTDAPATETAEAAPAAEVEVRPSLLEVWSENERMRHIPPLDWLIDKLDRDIRVRVDRLLTPIEMLPRDDERHAALDEALRSLSRALDRLASVTRAPRGSQHPPVEPTQHVRWSLNHAVTGLRGVDSTTFGRRYPFQTHERSRAEIIFGSLLAVIAQVHMVTSMVETIEPRIIERLCEGLVRLEQPLREEAIA